MNFGRFLLEQPLVRFELTGGGGSGLLAFVVLTVLVVDLDLTRLRLCLSTADFTPGSSRIPICAGGSHIVLAVVVASEHVTAAAQKDVTSFVNPVDGGAGGMTNFCAQGGFWGWHQCDGGCACWFRSRHTSFWCNVCVSTTCCPNNVCGCHGSNQLDTLMVPHRSVFLVVEG